MSEETKWVKNPAYDALGPENDVYVDPRFTHKDPATRAADHILISMSYRLWRFNARHEVTDTRPTNITEGAD